MVFALFLRLVHLKKRPGPFDMATNTNTASSSSSGLMMADPKKKGKQAKNSDQASSDRLSHNEGWSQGE